MKTTYKTVIKDLYSLILRHRFTRDLLFDCTITTTQVILICLSFIFETVTTARVFLIISFFSNLTSMLLTSASYKNLEDYLTNEIDGVKNNEYKKLYPDKLFNFLNFVTSFSLSLSIVISLLYK